MFIFKLLVLLALQPVAAAYAGIASLSGQSPGDMQGMTMDCQQMDQESCPDMGVCLLLGHKGCDMETSGIIPQSSSGNAQQNDLRYSSLLRDYLQLATETPQRPPRSN